MRPCKCFKDMDHDDDLMNYYLSSEMKKLFNRIVFLDTMNENPSPLSNSLVAIEPCWRHGDSHESVLMSTK